MSDTRSQRVRFYYGLNHKPFCLFVSQECPSAADVSRLYRLSEDTGWDLQNATSWRNATTRHFRPLGPRHRAPGTSPTRCQPGGKSASGEVSFLNGEYLHVLQRQPGAAGTASRPRVSLAALSAPLFSLRRLEKDGWARRGPRGRDRQKEGLAAQPAQPTEYQAGVKQTHIRKLFV